MYGKICPLLMAAGFVNGREECTDHCAWYVETNDREGCALSVIAEALADSKEEQQEE